ncbi:portal protein [uncultured Desulfovibrio sp.]|uniref:portal protein n=1 Tax=uncultured Desulfovibrio sp. TaxID=167968 RepID=UPI0026398EA4|nr:portal protein [uncultured Desulfovibrio sp.]
MSRLDEIQRFASHLDGLRSARMGRWQELARWLAPHRGVFDGELTTDRGERRNSEAFLSIGSAALRKGAAGLTSGMTPRNAPWFEAAFRNGDLWEMSGAPAWLDEVNARMDSALNAGGFYQAIHSFNTDLLWAGCALLYVEADETTDIRCECIDIGSFSVGMDTGGRLDSVVRRIRMTPARMAQIFGKDNLSDATRKALETAPYSPVEVIHVVRRRDMRDPGKLDAKSMPWASYFWEPGGEDFLREGGYMEMPYFFTTWNACGLYGTGPGDDALSDIRQIDKMERDKLVGLAKLVSPPVAAPIQYKDAVCLHPHAVNYVASNDAIRPIIDLAPWASAFQYLQAEVQNVAGRIEDELLASVFASVPLDQRPRDMSATEFLERKREALQQLGPVMSAYEPNVLTPLLWRVAGMLDRKGVMPPPPESLLGMPLAMKIDFVSPIANALRQTGAETTRALVQDVLALAQADPQALDKLDIDQAVDELATGLGAPGKVIRADADVLAIRQQRAQAQAAQSENMAMQQAVQMAQGIAQTAKTVSDMDTQNAASEAGNG